MWLNQFCIYKLKKLLVLCVLLNFIETRAEDPQSSCNPRTFYKENDKGGLLRGASFAGFHPIAPGSKYLAPPNLFKSNPASATAMCSQVGLEVARINNLEEYNHLKNIFFSNKQLLDDPFVAFNLGITKEDGIYVVVDPETQQKDVVRFQAFSMIDKNYFAEGKRCVALQCVNLRCIYMAMKCFDKGEKSGLEKWEMVLPLCQWKKDMAHCHNMDPSPPLVDDNMIMIGTTQTRTLYGSKFQAPHADALEHCQMKGMKLLSFIKGDKIESSEIFDLVEHYSTDLLKIPFFSIHAWTSGRFNKKYGPDNSFTFLSTGENWKYEENKGHWNWLDSGKIIVPKLEICMGISKLNERLIRGVLCTLANFFICTQDGGAPPPDKNSPPAPGGPSEEEQEELDGRTEKGPAKGKPQTGKKG